MVLGVRNCDTPPIMTGILLVSQIKKMMSYIQELTIAWKVRYMYNAVKKTFRMSLPYSWLEVY